MPLRLRHFRRFFDFRLFRHHATPLFMRAIFAASCAYFHTPRRCFHCCCRYAICYRCHDKRYMLLFTIGAMPWFAMMFRLRASLMMITPYTVSCHFQHAAAGRHQHFI